MVACQVVPDIPTFAVDDGFSYLVPDGVTVRVGSRVRIRVSGRRMKGFVTAVVPEPDDRRLIPLDGTSGDVPSFDGAMLDVLRWASTHYVAPLSTVLKRTIPPNVPRWSGERTPSPSPITHPTRAVIVSSAADHAEHIARIVNENLDRGTVTLVIAPTVIEVDAIVASLQDATQARIASATSSSAARDATSSWVAAAVHATDVLVGTREVMLWPVADLGSIVIVEDARRVMKSPSTPTLSVRDVSLRRSTNPGADVTVLTPVPSLETIAAGMEVVTPQGRQWPLVEIADRNDEPPTRSVLLERTRTAVQGTVRRGGTAFVLVPRRGYAPAFRCVRCGTLRRCPTCGAAATRGDACLRCATTLGDCPSCGGAKFEALGAGIGSVTDALRRAIGDKVGDPTTPQPVHVGTERDIVGHPKVHLAIAVDVDGMTFAPTYRSGEDALRLLVRLAQLVDRGRGHRMMVQTADANQPVVTALRSGRSETYLAEQLRERRKLGFPPAGELIAVETDFTVDTDDPVASALGTTATVLGPARVGDRTRWLIRDRDLGPARMTLRRLAGGLRDRGARVRIDVDPIDL